MVDHAAEQLSAVVKDLRTAIIGQNCQQQGGDGPAWNAHFGKARIHHMVWRLVSTTGVELTAEDNGQLFGLAKPLSVQNEFNSRLRDHKATDVTIASRTGDLSIEFGDRYRLDILVTSSGYESWDVNFTHDGLDQMLVCNGGNLSWHTSPAGSDPRMIVMTQPRIA